MKVSQSTQQGTRLPNQVSHPLVALLPYKLVEIIIHRKLFYCPHNLIPRNDKHLGNNSVYLLTSGFESVLFCFANIL